MRCSTTVQRTTVQPCSLVRGLTASHHLLLHLGIINVTLKNVNDFHTEGQLCVTHLPFELPHAESRLCWRSATVLTHRLDVFRICRLLAELMSDCVSCFPGGFCEHCHSPVSVGSAAVSGLAFAERLPVSCEMHAAFAR
jgi:hypothetical protein